MQSLLQILSDRESGSVVMIGSADSLSAKDLRKECEALRNGPLCMMKGKHITLCCHDTFIYLKMLIALDGWASRILLVDSILDDQTLERFEESLCIEWRIRSSVCMLEIEPKSRYTELRSEATEWIIPTSGTTGEPKLIAHDCSSMTRSLKPANNKSTSLRWGLIYSPTRFAGIQVLLQALIGRSAIIIPVDPTDVKSAVPLLAHHKCNALSATPSLWRNLAFLGMLASLDLEIVTLGGETADQKILDTLKKHYPNATIRHIYASTEAGVGFSVADCMAGFPASFLDTPPTGVELKLDEDGMLLLRPAKATQRLISATDSLIDEKGWIRSGDLVELRANRCHFLGRESGSINVGGHKVHPGHIEETLTEVPGVAAAKVYGKPNPVLGSLVVAEIVPEIDIDQANLRDRIITHCKSRLERYQTPALINFVKSFNLSTAGKVKR